LRSKVGLNELLGRTVKEVLREINSRDALWKALEGKY